MTELAAAPYPWYGVGSGSELQQGDLLLECPRFVLPPQVLAAPEEHKVTVETVNAIVMTQSCDLALRAGGRCEVRDVMLCRFLFRQELAQHATFKQDAEWANARKGKFGYFHVLNRCELPDFPLDYMLVDFHEVFTLNVDLVRHFATSKGRWPRLLPPYREHLAQAFARLFMRVGLPTDIPPFGKKK
jgi:hypothetical protein